MKAKKKILSLLLAIAMILGMLPMTGLPVYAADEPQILEVSTWDQLSNALFSSNSGITIKLTKDITFEYEYRGKRPGYTPSPPEDLLVHGTKSLDLNGHTIEYINKVKHFSRNLSNFTVRLFTVEAGATLHMLDSRGKGSIVSDGYMLEDHQERFDNANIFFVEHGGTLVIDGGSYQAGRQKKVWAFDSRDFRSGSAALFTYHGWAHRILDGKAIINDGGKVIINDGQLVSTGNNLLVSKREGAEYIINGGTFIARGGGDCFETPGYKESSSITINGGSFDTARRLVLTGVASGGGNAFDLGMGDPQKKVHYQQGSLYIYPSYLNINAQSYKLGGKSIESIDGFNNLNKAKECLEVTPGYPKLTLSPEKLYGHHTVALHAQYKITATAEPYFIDIGLGRPARLGHKVYKTTDLENPVLGESMGLEDEFYANSSDVARTDYFYVVTEYLNKKEINSAGQYFTFDVQDIPNSAVVEITTSKKFADLNEEVTLTANANMPITTYEWFYSEGGNKVVVGNDETYTFSKGAPGAYYYACQVTNEYGQKSNAGILNYVGRYNKPTIAENQLHFKEGVKIDGFVLPKNTGGEADRWEFTGTLPQGLRYTRTQGFTGTPTEAGVFPVTATAENEYGTDTKVIRLIVSKAGAISTDSLPDCATNTANYEANLVYTGGGDVTWSVAAGALPKGLELSMTEGLISGKPEESGLYYFTVKAQVSGEPPATKELFIKVHGAPKYPASITENIPQDKNYRIPNPLTEGRYEAGISYWLTGPVPTGVSVDMVEDDIGYIGDIVTTGTPAGEYSFTIHAENDYGEASAPVTLKVVSSPMFTMESQLLPMGEVNRPYSSEGHIKAFPTENECVFVLTKAVTLPDGLTFDEKTGAITGTPTEDTGTYENGSIKLLTLNFKYVDTQTNVESDESFMMLRIAESNSFSEPTMALERNVWHSNVYEVIGLTVGGLPPSKVTLTDGNLPFGMNIGPFVDDYVIQGRTHINGTYTFTLEAENQIGTKIEKSFTVTVKDPEKALAPIATPGSGTYKKGETINVTLSNDGEGFIVASLNGGPEKTYTSDDTIEITEDTVLKVYSENFGLAYLNSDLVTYNYVFVEGTGDVVTINTTALPEGERDKAYTELQLSGSSSEGKEIKWEAAGLPEGMALSNDGKLSGTPEEARTFMVNLFAKTENGSDQKDLPLVINDKVLSPAGEPNITIQPADKSYDEDAAASPMTVGASSPDEGTISYLWYESKDKANNTPSDDSLLGVGPTYTPATGITGDRYYYAVAVNSKKDFADTRKASRTATITVLYDAASPVFDDMEDMDYTFTQSTPVKLYDRASVSDGGEITYQWHKMSGATPKPETDAKIGERVTEGELSLTVAAAPTVEKYYMVATNTNNAATGKKTATATGPIHIVTSTDKMLIQDISISKFPGKMSYKPGESFNPAGMEVQAAYSNLTTAVITGYTYAPVGSLSTSDRVITVSYKDPETDTTFETYFPIEVKAPSGGGGGGGAVAATYKLTFETNGGDAVSSISNAQGTLIDLGSYKPVKTGFVFGGWYSDKELTKAVKSITLNADTTVYAKWIAGTTAPGLPFTDVQISDWFYGDVKYVFEKGLMSGISKTLFAPSMTTTRGMIVTILHRLEGSPAVSGENSFDDVAKGKWYTEAVNWAAENKIVAGYGNAKFGPDDNITREQMAAILMNYAKFKGYDVSAKADLSKFTDNSKISQWAAGSLAWANANGLISGKSSGILDPKGQATRAEVAAILHRFCDTFK